MRLEDSEGKILDPVKEEELVTVLDKVGKSLDFCILSDNDNFIQTAGSDGGLLAQYKDGSGQYESNETTLSYETVKEMFVSYLNGSSSWKTAATWSEMDGGYESEPSRDNSSSQSSAPDVFSVDGIKKTVMNAVKSEANRGFSYAIRRFIRNIFR